MNILGISALYHDSAAALIVDGDIVAAAQEERFTRKKHDSALPINAIKYCLNEGNINTTDLNYIVFYDDPLLTLDRYMKNVLALGESASDLLDFGYERLLKKLWIHDLLKKELPDIGKTTSFLVAKHHISHAASAFYPSPFDKSIILTVDGVGEWSTLTVGIGDGNAIKLKQEIRYPHSLGMLYSALAYFCGFKVNSGEYKFMGLAPYGNPVYYDKIRDEIIDVKSDGSFRLNLDYFDFYRGRTMICEKKMSQLFNGGGRRLPETQITKREMDIAASTQLVIEKVLLKIVNHAKQTFGKNIDNLCLAGGVALNCVANGRILKENIFKNIWIQPAAGDAGGALGAALYVWFQTLSNERKSDSKRDKQKNSCLGISFDNDYIKQYLDQSGLPYNKPNNLNKCVAELLAQQKIIGLFRGRMEFGPRALGNRSIIADPRSDDMQTRLNMKIKFRESFRPFAPSVLVERTQDYFELNVDSPYMLLVADVQKKRQLPFNLNELLIGNKMNMLPIVSRRRSDIPAVTHVDYSARIQTVSSVDNPQYYAIIKAFEQLTGCGVIVNTSFNVRGEPIVCTPQDAYRCFMRSDMDVLILNDFVLYKEEQPKFNETDNWQEKYELD